MDEDGLGGGGAPVTPGPPGGAAPAGGAPGRGGALPAPSPGAATHGAILALAVPNVLANLSVPLLGIVDTAAVGHLEGLADLGAVAIGATAFQTLYWGLVFLRMSTTAWVSQEAGAGRPGEGEAVLARGAAVALAAAAFVLVAQRPLRELIYWFLQAPPAVLPAARAYFDVRVWAAPAALLTLPLHGWFLGVADARSPMAMVMVANVVNAGLDWYLVRVAGWGAVGVAYGTTISQYLALAVGWGLFRVRAGRWLPRVGAGGLADPAALRRLGRASADLLIRSASLVGVLALFTSRAAAAGPETLAVTAVLLPLWTLHAYLVDGYAYAAETLVGRAAGAGDAAGLAVTVRRLMAWGVAVSAAVAAAYWAGRATWVGMLTADPGARAGALAVFAWTALAPLVNAVAFVWDGVYLGVGATRALRDAMLFCGAAVFVPALLIAEAAGAAQGHGLWAALTAWEVARAAVLTRGAARHVYEAAAPVKPA